MNWGTVMSLLNEWYGTTKWWTKAEWLWQEAREKLDKRVKTWNNKSEPKWKRTIETTNRFRIATTDDETNTTHRPNVRKGGKGGEGYKLVVTVFSGFTACFNIKFVIHFVLDTLYQEYNQSFNRLQLSFQRNVSIQLKYLLIVLRVSITKANIVSDFTTKKRKKIYTISIIRHWQI